MHLLLKTFSFCDVLGRHTQAGCTRCTGRTSHAGHMSCRMKPDVVHTTPYINIVNTTEPSTLAVPVHQQEFESKHTQLNRNLAATTVVTTVIRNPSIRKNTCTRTACLSRGLTRKQQMCHTMKENIHYCIMCTSEKTEHPIG